MPTKSKRIGKFRVVLTFTKPTLSSSGKSKVEIWEKESMKGVTFSSLKRKGGFSRIKKSEFQTAQTGNMRYLSLKTTRDILSYRQG